MIYPKSIGLSYKKKIGSHIFQPKLYLSLTLEKICMAPDVRAIGRVCINVNLILSREGVQKRILIIAKKKASI